MIVEVGFWIFMIAVVVVVGLENLFEKKENYKATCKCSATIETTDKVKFDQWNSVHSGC